MAIDYAERLKELGFKIRVPEINRGVISKGEINWENYFVGFYDANKSPQIRLMINEHSENSSLEKQIDAAETLKDNKIPHYIVPQDIVSYLKEQVETRKNLLKRIKKLRPQNQ